MEQSQSVVAGGEPSNAVSHHYSLSLLYRSLSLNKSPSIIAGNFRGNNTNRDLNVSLVTFICVSLLFYATLLDV